jgi:hypothetical protein
VLGLAIPEALMGIRACSTRPPPPSAPPRLAERHPIVKKGFSSINQVLITSAAARAVRCALLRAAYADSHREICTTTINESRTVDQFGAKTFMRMAILAASSQGQNRSIGNFSIAAPVFRSRRDHSSGWIAKGHMSIFVSGHACLD